MLDDFSEGIKNKELIEYRENIKTALDIESGRDKVSKINVLIEMGDSRFWGSDKLKTEREVAEYIKDNLIMFKINKIKVEFKK